MDKYDRLYDLALDVYAEELRRCDEVEHKAARYFTVLSFLLAGVAFFLKWITGSILPPSTVLEWLLLGCGGLCAGSLTWAWATVFRAYGFGAMRKLPLDPDMIGFFREHRDLDIKFALAKRMAGGHRVNRAINDRKIRFLSTAHRAIWLAFTSLMLLMCLYVSYCWMHRATGRWQMKDEKPTGQAASPEGASAQSDQEPDDRVEAPEMDVVMLSDDSGKTVSIPAPEAEKAEPSSDGGKGGKKD